MALTPKQQRFVDEYLVDLNATAAYKRAGYKGKGRTAENNASRLLGNAGVRKAIEARREKQAKRTTITADWVLARLKVESEREGKGTSHSARVNALGKLGDHLGLFEIHLRQTVVNEVPAEKTLAELNDATVEAIAGILEGAHAGPGAPGNGPPQDAGVHDAHDD